MATSTRTRLLAAAAVGYLTGTVPSADVAARLAARGGGGAASDLRAEGSGNPGAVNAMAVLGKGWGYGVLAADIAKGMAACTAGRAVAGGTGAHVAGTAAVVGHCFPVWTGFRGGKGVAAAIGQCGATFPVSLPIDLAAAVVAGRTRPPGARAGAATVAGSLAWVVAGVVWWRRGLPNLWGPRPTAALPLAAAATGAVVLHRFARA